MKVGASLLLVGCISTADKRLAIQTASNEVRRIGWTDFEVTGVQRTGDNLLVAVRRLPPVPGGHADIEVSKEGNVLHYYGGK